MTKVNGDLIKSRRKEYAITQKELGSRCNVTSAYIHQLERNKKSNPSAELIIKIADTLNLDIRELSPDLNNTLITIEDNKSKNMEVPRISNTMDSKSKTPNALKSLLKLYNCGISEDAIEIPESLLEKLITTKLVYDELVGVIKHDILETELLNK